MNTNDYMTGVLKELEQLISSETEQLQTVPAQSMDLYLARVAKIDGYRAAQNVCQNVWDKMMNEGKNASANR